MKIAMVSEHASPLATLGEVDAGGQNVHVAELSAALVRAGHEVTVYTRRDSRRLPSEVDTEDGYHVVHVPAGPARKLPKDDLLPYMGKFGTFLRDRWSVDPPDLAHAHFWMSGVATALAARPAAVPMVETFHALGAVKKRYQGANDTSPADRVRLERMIANRTEHIIATCTNEVFELARMGVPRGRMSVVPCGVDLDRFTPQGPTDERGAPHRLLTVGRLVPRKGFDVVIAALALLPNTELVIAGGPGKRQFSRDVEACRLRGLADRLGVADRVRFLGQTPHEDMPALLRSADVVVCTPWYEPFGIVPLEAMACAVPVVAAAVGGLTDTVVDGVTGLLVRPHAPRELAAQIRKLLSDPALGFAYGVAGHERAHVRYSWDRVAADTARVYRRLVPGGSREAVYGHQAGVPNRT